ncbi:(2E,6E)-farnesyl diphosphate synthase [Aliiglaciecola litoralis]|uniref:(2E,6E)-farnesyl diphosphate synthase n=1 Tax=Aliiglaciecola litoralis TaxID=582857 RepID=A0ABP3X1N2_9ALTE
MLTEKQQQYQARINQQISQRLDGLGDHAPRLKQAMQYSMLNGGKRMRPFLVYATGEMLGAELVDLDPVALAIECIHAYSLVHDDLPAMDDDDLRRGKPTCHIAFDEASAILAGDALQTLAFDIIANASFTQNGAELNLKLLKILSNASGYQGMCGGQAMDLAATGASISQTQLQHLHNLKTGALIKASVDMAACLSAKIDAQTNKLLDEFSSALGLAFQVQDDILDVVGDSQTLGKPQGSDQAHNKSTYPALLGLSGAKDYLHQLHQQALHALDALPYNTRLLKEFTQFIVQRNY